MKKTAQAIEVKEKIRIVIMPICSLGGSRRYRSLSLPPRPLTVIYAVRRNNAIPAVAGH
ncbi:MAG: hypothetical protein JKX88_10715 [Marinicaulis sp.]|nr:hypothetical protein [Marinicaulis sp.]